MVLECLNDLAEPVISERFDVVVPSGKVEPCDSRSGVLVKDVHEIEIEVVCLLQIREHLKQYPSPCLLGVPLGPVHEDDVAAACHNLRFGFTVGHPLRLPFTYDVFLGPQKYEVTDD